MKGGSFRETGKNILSEKYVGVRSAEIKSSGRRFGRKWYAALTNDHKGWFSPYFNTEREAAIAYDKRCIELGLPPKNILKKL